MTQQTASISIYGIEALECQNQMLRLSYMKLLIFTTYSVHNWLHTDNRVFGTTKAPPQFEIESGTKLPRGRL